MKRWRAGLLLATLVTLAACQSDTPVDGNSGSNNGDNNGSNNGADMGDNNANNGANNTNNGGNNGADMGDEPDLPPEPTCQDNRDCRGGEICREGSCREACSAEDPCAGELSRCDEAQGICVGCLEDSDCGANEVCGADQRCGFFCQDDAACGQGEVCDGANGTCVERQCEQDGDCQGGFQCGGGLCLPIDEIICEPSSARCEGQELVQCSRDGTREAREACLEPQLCAVDSQGQAACLEPICQPFEVGCLDNQTAFACNDQGTEQTALPCRADQRCEGGGCVALACQPGSITCEGDTRVVCDERGATREATRCDDTPDCQGQPFGCACTQGDCVARICQPGSARCVGNAVQTCNEQGSAWSAPASCQGEEICTEGRCLSEICEPGELACAGDSILTCSQDGSQRVPTACPQGQTCTGEGQEITCQPVICEPNAVTCEGGTAIARCNDDGTQRALEGCADRRVCVSEDGAVSCRQLICSPSSSGCVDEDTAFDCDSTGTRSTTRACPQGLTCSGEGICSARICEPGQRVCRDQGATGLCNQDGTGYDEIQACGSEASCQQGRCISDCELGQESFSHIGCEFWSVDLDNLDTGEDTPHSVVLINPDPVQSASVEIRLGDQVELGDTQIGPGDFLVHNFPIDRELEATGRWSDRAWRITSTVPLVAYQFNPIDGREVNNEFAFFTSDASLLLPVSATDTAYMALSWPNRNSSGNWLKGFMSIIAVEPGTTAVTVTPSVAISAGQGTPALTQGEPWNTTLTQGQVLHLTQASDVDITGTFVRTNRRVVAFSGHECANVPNENIHACDHIEQQLFPTSTWGTRYLAAPFAPRNSRQVDTWRVVASRDNTVLTTDPVIEGLHNQTLMRGQAARVETNQAFMITSNFPVLVGQYMHGANYTGFAPDADCGTDIFNLNNSGVGDPAFSLAIPVEQHRQDYSVLTPASYRDNYLTLIAPVDANIRIDNGAPFNGFPEIGDTGYFYANIDVSDGFHQVTGDRPFGLVAHGYNCFVSYAYPAGLNLRTLR